MSIAYFNPSLKNKQFRRYSGLEQYESLTARSLRSIFTDGISDEKNSCSLVEIFESSLSSNENQNYDQSDK